MRRRELGILAITNLVAVWSLVWLGYGMRAVCSVSTGIYQWVGEYLPYVCYTDVYAMWQYRGLSLHLPPYFVGTYSPPSTLGNGAVEYPVFSGVMMWLTALPATNYGGFFLITTIVAGVLASVVALLLVFLVGRWSYLWSFSPLLLLYGSYNWDLYPILATVLGLAVVLRGPARWSDTRRASVAAVLLAIGCLFKLYPAFFVLPLAAWLALRHTGDLRARVRVALRPIAICVGVVIAGNLPFAIFGFEGWFGSLRFQSYRAISKDAMSIWYWWTLPLHHGAGYSGSALPVVTALALVAIAAGFAVAFWWGFRRFEEEGVFPWVSVSGAMLVAYMLLGKVNSPQYGFWLVPFLVVLAVPTWVAITYVVANLLFYSAYFHPAFLADLPWDGVVAPLLVTLDAAALVLVFVSFMRADVRPLLSVRGVPLFERFRALPGAQATADSQP